MQVRDPVCGMLIEDTTAPAQSQYFGETYYFCSQSCKEAFEEEPEEYLAKTPESVDQ